MKYLKLIALSTATLLFFSCQKENNEINDGTLTDASIEWIKSESWMQLNGWTEFKPSIDTRIMYVAADGNDETAKYYVANEKEISTDPFKPSGNIKAFASYTAAAKNARRGYPDWILFKRGDTFKAMIRPTAGRGENELSLVGAYGISGNSPIIHPLNEKSFVVYIDARKDDANLSFTAISSIDFYSEIRDPSSDNYKGEAGLGAIKISTSPGGNVRRLLFEGCKFRFFNDNAINGVEGASIREIIFRRCVFASGYSAGNAHCQGLYAYRVDGLFLQENIFDHNGWLYQAPKTPGKATIFNHNTYFSMCTKVNFSNNIFLRASSIHNKFAEYVDGSLVTDIALLNNVYIDGEVGSSFSINVDNGGYKNVAIMGNVFTEIGRSQPTNRTLGFGVEMGHISSSIIKNNYMVFNSNPRINNTFGYQLNGDINDLEISENVVYNIKGPQLVITAEDGLNKEIVVKNNIFYDTENKIGTIRAEYTENVTFSNNTYYSNENKFNHNGEYLNFDDWKSATNDNSSASKHHFSDATRNIESYNSSIGGAASIGSFIESCRAQSRFNWNENYTALKVATWIKDGFK